MSETEWEEVRAAGAHLKGKVMTVELPHEAPLHAMPMLILPTPWPADVAGRTGGFQAGLIPAPEGMRPLENLEPLTFILRKLANG